MPSVLFLCLGNICRSPLAEGAFRALVGRRPDVESFELDSAGTGGWHAGEAPDPRSVATARRHGVDISSQRARQLTPEDFARYDWIVAMDAENLETASRRRPPGEAHARARLVAMIDFVHPEVRGRLRGIPDPYYGGLDGFEEVWALLSAGMPNLLEAVEVGLLESGARPHRGSA